MSDTEPTLFTGWCRENHKHPWRKVSEGETEHAAGLAAINCTVAPCELLVTSDGTDPNKERLLP